MYMWDKSMAPVAEAVIATGASEPTATPDGISGSDCDDRSNDSAYDGAYGLAGTAGADRSPKLVLGDNGDGTFTNPVLALDYSDPDVIRVGEDYYMVTSTFMDCPGNGGSAF